jgi:DNA polymerase sigma
MMIHPGGPSGITGAQPIQQQAFAGKDQGSLLLEMMRQGGIGPPHHMQPNVPQAPHMPFNRMGQLGTMPVTPSGAVSSQHEVQGQQAVVGAPVAPHFAMYGSCVNQGIAQIPPHHAGQIHNNNNNNSIMRPNITPVANPLERPIAFGGIQGNAVSGEQVDVAALVRMMGQGIALNNEDDLRAAIKNEKDEITAGRDTNQDARELQKGETLKSPNATGSTYQQRQNRWVDIMDHKHDGREPIASMTELNGKLIRLAESLSPTEEDKRSWETAFMFVQNNLVKLLGPHIDVVRFGSTANGLSVRSSNDIDVSVQIADLEKIEDEEYQAKEKGELIEKIGSYFESLRVKKILILANARVPVVKFTYPETGTHVDITINNTLACLNTKLLADYCAIDHRLPQMVSIVKHWAKQRDVNDPYQGTLSSYCYVLMCIFHLQTRSPAILPVLQDLPPTVSEQVGEWKVSYFDNVEELKGFGSKNTQTLAELVWEFFEYWAWRHDYQHSVVSIRLGKAIPKEDKDWTKRVGRDRHLLCVEDPFLLSHDLGRTVDRQSKDVMRKEFFRAATILRDHLHPEIKLFEKFIPRSRKF